MYFVYILKSMRVNAYYIGVTSDMKRRLAQHNASENRSTKRYIPWRMVYLEGYASEEDA